MKLKCIKQWNELLDFYPETDFTKIKPLKVVQIFETPHTFPNSKEGMLFTMA